MKYFIRLFFVLLMIVSFCLAGCGSDSTTVQGATVGWAVGVAKDRKSPAVFKTLDGVQWTQIISDQFTGSEGRNVCAIDNQCAWLSLTGNASHGKILVTQDGGLTWQDKSPTDDAFKSTIGINIKALSRTTVYAAGDNYLAVTKDGGTTWTPITPKGHLATTSYTHIEAFDQQHVWAVGGNTDTNQTVVERTLDGITWETLPPIPGEAIILGLAVKQPNTVRITCNQNGNLYTSDSAGATWNDPVNILIADLNDVAAFGNTVWVVGDHGIFGTSTDGGKTFSEGKLPGNYSDIWTVALAALDEKRIWVGGLAGGSESLGGLLWSNDGGKTWNEPKPTLYGFQFWRISFVGGVK